MMGIRTGGLAVTLLAVVATGCGEAERGESGDIETAGSVDAFAMRVGDCFDDHAAYSSQVQDLPGVPCSAPHDNEVFAVFDIGESEWPGKERVDELAQGGCLERFEAAIGRPYDESVLEITTLTPTEGSWSERADREVVCAAYHMDQEKLTGSVLNSGL